MRITQKDLENMVDRINEATNQPMKPWQPYDGKSVANVGNYHLSYAYGGVKLHQMTNEHGGVRDVLTTGYTTKKDLFNHLNSFLYGLATK
jgi:hypothetical protein